MRVYEDDKAVEVVVGMELAYGRRYGVVTRINNQGHLWVKFNDGHEDRFTANGVLWGVGRSWRSTYLSSAKNARLQEAKMAEQRKVDRLVNQVQDLLGKHSNYQGNFSLNEEQLIALQNLRNALLY